VLLRRAAAGVEVLLQLRAAWTHEGGTWGVPGGARDSHESVVGAALREAAEETGVVGTGVSVLGEHLGVDHGNWSYTYVLALAGATLPPLRPNAESAELRWVALADVPGLPLHPALASAWAGLVPHLALPEAREGRS
jgi:8-oxo-dGTP diphosphatase